MKKTTLQLYSKRMQEEGKPERPYFEGSKLPRCPNCGRRYGVYIRKHMKPSLRCYKCRHTFDIEDIED